MFCIAAYVFKVVFDNFVGYYLIIFNKTFSLYVLKFDISKYFYNIDHEILKSMLREIYVDDDVYKILCEIIDATNSKYINGEIDKCIERERIRLSKIGCRESSILSQQLDAIPYYYDIIRTKYFLQNLIAASVPLPTLVATFSSINFGYSAGFT